MRKIVLLFILFSSFALSQTGVNVKAKTFYGDSLRTLSSNPNDTIWIKSRADFTRPARFDSALVVPDTIYKVSGGLAYKNGYLYYTDGSTWIRVIPVSDSTIVSAGTYISVSQSGHTATVSVDTTKTFNKLVLNVVTGSNIFTARQYLTSAGVDTLTRKSNSWNGLLIRGLRHFLVDSTETAQYQSASSLEWWGRKFNDTVVYVLSNSFASTNGGARFGLTMTKGLSGGLPNGSRFLNFMLIDTARNIRWNNFKSSEFTYGDFFIDNGKFTVTAGNVRFDSNLTVYNGGRFYRNNSTYDTMYSPVESRTHNAPAFNPSLAMSHDYYSYVGVSQDAVLGLFSQDEGDHGSTLDLGEVGLTSGAIVNKWTIGRGSTGGSNKAGLSISYGTNKDYTLNTTKIFMDTLGGTFFNRNSTVANVLMGVYSKGSQQRMALDTTGRITLSNQTTSGDWVLSLDTYDASQGSVFLGRKARGTQASPTQAQANDILLFLSGRGYTNSSAFGTANVGVIRIMANEAVTSSAQGTYIDIATTPNGSTTRAVQTIWDNSNGTSRITFGSTAGTGRSGRMYLNDTGYVVTTQIWDASRNFMNIGTISQTGAGFVKVANATTEGDGVVSTPDTVRWTAQTGSIAAVNFSNTATGHQYRFTYSLITTTASGSGSPTITITASYNNGSAAKTQTSATLDLATLGAEVNGQMVFYVGSGTPTFNTTLASSSGSPQYKIEATLERVK